MINYCHIQRGRFSRFQKDGFQDENSIKSILEVTIIVWDTAIKEYGNSRTPVIFELLL